MKTAIFDFDGTIFESPQYWIDTMNDYLTARGYPAQDDIFDIVKPMGVKRGAAYFKDKFSIEDDVADIVKAWRGRMGVNYHTVIPLKEYVIEYLEKLKGEGKKICLATAMERDFIMPALERTGIKDYFDEIISIEDITKDKSDPEIYLICADRTGASPEECTVFEDAPANAQVAHNAGFKVIGVFDGVSTGDYEKIKPYSNGFIRSFKELL